MHESPLKRITTYLLLIVMFNYQKKKKTVLKWSLFCLYTILMGYLYLHYKKLVPTFDPSMLNGTSYLVNTEGYKLPDFNPFDSSVITHILSPPKLDCSRGKRPLTTGISNYVNSTSLQPLFALIINEEHKADYGVQSFSCCYQSITTDDPDKKFKKNLVEDDYPGDKYVVEKQCHPLKNRTTFIKSEAVFTICTSNSEVIYKNVHYFLQPKNSSNSKNSSLFGNESESRNNLNVLILGLDSVSRINAQRYLPKTLKVLSDIEAIDLRGYNKHSENTYPILTALLAGHFLSDPKIKESIKSGGGFYDNYPFIWKDFSAAGYKTVFAEDCPPLGTFNYKKKGFKYPPTDYYMRPYFKAAEEFVGWRGGIVWLSGCEICLGPKSVLNTLLDYAKDLSLVFKRDPYFSLIWSSAITHDRVHFAGVADDPVAKFVRQMYDEDRWNNTVVFLLSDHGIRFGTIRETYIGKMEESLPFNFIILPKWFKNVYPTAYGNLYHNQFRLTTPFDIHETLKDILNENYKNETYLEESHDPLKSSFKLSLFKNISGTRTCSDARIPLNYCAGMETTEISQTSEVKLAAKAIVQFINKGLKKYPVCHQLTKFKINKSYLVQFYEKENDKNIMHYEVQITTFPGEAILEAIVKTRTSESQILELSIAGTVSRLNSYDGQSYCIDDLTYIKYCLCKTPIPKNMTHV